MDEVLLVYAMRFDLCPFGREAVFIRYDLLLVTGNTDLSVAVLEGGGVCGGNEV